jgi:hypothetical protein
MNLQHTDHIKAAHKYFGLARGIASEGKTDEAIAKLALGLDHLTVAIALERGHIVDDIKDTIAHEEEPGGGLWCR